MRYLQLHHPPPPPHSFGFLLVTCSVRLAISAIRSVYITNIPAKNIFKKFYRVKVRNGGLQHCPPPFRPEREINARENTYFFLSLVSLFCTSVTILT